MPAGRPLKFKTVEEVQERIDDYFASFEEGRENHGKRYLISGLALHLDVCTQTLLNYEEKQEFFAPIKRARQRVEMAYEEMVVGQNATGPIFMLKNLGFKDSQEVSVMPSVVIKDYTGKHNDD